MTSFNTENNFDLGRIQTKVIVETSFSKEIKIILPKGEVMKDHKAPFPILIHLLKGAIELGVETISFAMKKGDIIGLESNKVHHLIAKENAIVRLSLSKYDEAKRVENVIKNS